MMPDTRTKFNLNKHFQEHFARSILFKEENLLLLQDRRAAVQLVAKRLGSEVLALKVAKTKTPGQSGDTSGRHNGKCGTVGGFSNRNP
jgi:hypothetical protein